MKFISVYPSSISVISRRFNEENFYENKYLPVGNVVGTDGNVFRTLMMFDIKDKILNTYKIKSATLNLCVEKNIYNFRQVSGNKVFLNNNTEEYNPLAVNWNNAPSYEYTDNFLIIEGNKDEHFLSVDVSEMVNKWFNYYEENFGLTLTGMEDVENCISIFSYSRNRNKPYLSLEVEA
ncbi:DNRLRE domain-containing protein [Clostridium sp. ZBS15]|uniref:DNRLRE domain-containing protein n=1 Tax=Clostridium sp. ZBS15 TaxID=2949969 RepID=UPI00207950AB|nr:DNRLRE domain-containing protein [Clostridium sp. ZBS15]